MVHFTQKEQHEAAAAALAACQHKQQLMQRQQYVPVPATAEPLFQHQPQPYFAYQQQQQPGAPAVFQFAPPGLTFAPPPTLTATPAMMMMMPTTTPLPQQPLQHPVAAAPHGHLVIPHQHQQNGLIVTNVNVLPERFKTKLCRNFMKDGKCQYEHRCMFAHGQDDLRTTEMNLNDGLITEEAIRSFQRASKTRDEEGSCNSSTSGETEESSADLVSSQVLIGDQHLEVKNSPSSPIATNQHA